MPKQKKSRIKKAEDRILAMEKMIVNELQRVGHHVNLTMNTINEYIMYNGDIEGFEEHIKKITENNKKKAEKKLDKKEEE
tara:strand:+ start:4289 stop:4528 length:240 start_codon:yes stop_codon:yes gene_type:complete